MTENKMKIQYYISSKDEEWMRVKARDRYLLIQLAVQAILFGLAIGVTISGTEIKTTSQHPELLILSLPISLVFVLLYNIEDRVIGLISEHIKNSYKGVENWDSSKLLNEVYARQGLFYRLAIQIIAFLIIPLLISWQVDLIENTLLSFKINTKIWCMCWAISITAILVKGYWHRLKSFGMNILRESFSPKKRRR